MAAVQTTYHHRDESTAIERACRSEIIGPANAGPPDPLRRLCKVQNPRRITRIKPIMRVYWLRLAVKLYSPVGSRCYAASCILVWGKAGPAIRLSRTILHDALNGQTARSDRSCFMLVWRSHTLHVNGEGSGLLSIIELCPLSRFWRVICIPSLLDVTLSRNVQTQHQRCETEQDHEPRLSGD